MKIGAHGKRPRMQLSVFGILKGREAMMCGYNDWPVIGWEILAITALQC